MKTKMHLMLLPVVLVIASIFISCNSIGIAEEKELPLPPFYVKSQEIEIRGGPPICAELDPNTQCWEKFTDCKGNILGGDGINKEDFFLKVFSQARKVNYILGSSCDSFIVDVEGNTRWCCTPRKCYRCD